MIPTTNNSIDVHHQTTTSGKTTWESTASISGVSCYIESLSPEMAMMYDNSKAYDMFKIFCNIEAIVRGDKLIDEQSREYIVHGVQRMEFNTDVSNHIEIVAYKSSI